MRLHFPAFTGNVPHSDGFSTEHLQPHLPDRGGSTLPLTVEPMAAPVGLTVTLTEAITFGTEANAGTLAEGDVFTLG